MKVSMFWKSYYGNEPLHLDLPNDWRVNRVGLDAPPPLSDQEIAAALDEPVGSGKLEKVVRGKRSVCIAVDDLTKPTEAWRIAPLLVAKLLKAGINKDTIYFVISLGTHRALTLGEFRKNLGHEIVENYRIYNHNPYQNNRYFGKTRNGTKLYINAFFLDADFRIGIGMLMPHNLAGFSGGGKIVLPGLAGIDTVEANHRSTLRGLQGRIGSLEGNQVRDDIERGAELAGLDFIVNSIHGEDGRTVGLYSGIAREAYPVAVRAAQQIYACNVPYQNDIGIFNAFPRDSWLLLSLSSLDVWSTRENRKAVVRPGGSIVIINHCSEGAGEHGLHSKGMKHYVKRDEHRTFKEILRGRNLIFLSPNLNAGVIRDYYRKEVGLFHEWSKVLTEFRAFHGSGARVGVFPCGTLQMDRAVLN